MRPPTSPGSEAGLTLLEVLVVVAVLAVLAAAVPGAIGSGPPGHEDTARAVVSTLREARAAAIRTGRPVAVGFDTGARRWGLPGRETPLPDGVGLALRSARGAETADGSAAIRFFPDGSASGGVVAVTGRGETVRLEVRWLTGLVRRDG